MGYVETNTKSFEADGAISQYARVKFEADSKVVVAGIEDIGDGIAMLEAFEAGDLIPVKLWSAGGTFPMIVEEQVEAADTLYTAAAGKVQDTAAATSFKFAKALQAGSGDGSVIETVLLHAAGVSAESA